MVLFLEGDFAIAPDEVHISYYFVGRFDSSEDVSCFVEHEFDGAAKVFKFVSEGNAAVVIINDMWLGFINIFAEHLEIWSLVFGVCFLWMASSDDVSAFLSLVLSMRSGCLHL